MTCIDSTAPRSPAPGGKRPAPERLQPIPRAPGRAAIGIAGAPPFDGVDIWNAYELSWLDRRGKPHVALATFVFPAGSASLIESKSLKLYLNSFSMARMAGADEVGAAIAADLGAASGAAVEVRLTPPARFPDEAIAELAGESIDDLEAAITAYEPAPEALSAGGAVVEETLATRLLKTNCPVTGQPDWGSLQVRYRGPRLDREGLLRYIVSFREHRDFHEQCVERMFVDILRRCRPEALTLYARYTRRGGIDINPFRTNCRGAPPANLRTARQ